MSYFNWNEVQSVHSTIVGLVSCVPTIMLESEQKSSFPQWFLHCETVHLMFLLGFELQLIRVPSVFCRTPACFDRNGFRAIYSAHL